MAYDLRASALEHHRFPRPGKLAIQAAKPMASQRDLSLAYSPVWPLDPSRFWTPIPARFQNWSTARSIANMSAFAVVEAQTDR